VDEDEPLFLSLVSDLFPGIQIESGSYVELQAAIAHAIEENKIINHDTWNLKVLQVCVIIILFISLCFSINMC